MAKIELNKSHVIQAGILAGILAVSCIYGAVYTERYGSGTGREEKQVYNLTVLAPVTGSLSYVGEPAAWAAEYAEQVINDSGGINGYPVDIAVVDTEFDNSLVLSEAQQIVKDQRFFIGPFDSPGTEAIANLVESNKIPNIATYTSDLIRQTAPYGYSYMNDTNEGEKEAIRQWKTLNPDIENVVIFVNEGDSAQQETVDIYNEYLPTLGMNILKVVEVDSDQYEGMPAVVEALNEKADGYILLTRAETCGKVVSELRKRGVSEGRRITASFTSYTADVAEKYKESLADTYVWSQFDITYSGQEWRNLVKTYEEEHDGRLLESHLIPDTYNAIMAWKQCMEELQLEPTVSNLEEERQEIAQWFYNSGELEGIQGTYQWVNGKKKTYVYNYMQYQEDGTLEKCSK